MSEQGKKVLYLTSWEDLEELTPLQNRWLRTYTKPSTTVNLQSWAKNQPKGFSLEYLLTHAISSHWDLTEVGWREAEKLGLLANREKVEGSADNDDANWLTHAEAAKQLHRETSDRHSYETLKSRISKMANKGKLTTNGKSRREIRFLKSDIDTLELKLRNDILAADGDEEDDDE